MEKIFRQIFNSNIDFLLALCCGDSNSTLLITVFLIINVLNYLSLTKVFSYVGKRGALRGTSFLFILFFFPLKCSLACSVSMNYSSRLRNKD